MPAIYGLINEERAQHDLPPLANDGELALNCTLLVATGEPRHGGHLPPGARAELTSRAPNWKLALDQWMGSPWAREIILSSAWARMGASTAAYGLDYWCVEFS